MRKKSIIALFCAAILLSGCSTNSKNLSDLSGDANSDSGQLNANSASNPGDENLVSGQKNTNSSSKQEEEDLNTDVASYSDMFTERDAKSSYDETSAINITLSGDSASCASPLVSISESTVTIRGEGTYVISGTLDNGMIIVDTDKNTKVQLVFNGVSIHKSDSAALYIKSADKVFVTLAEDTKNTLSGGETYTAIDENNIDSVIFSKDDLTLNGNGSLIISSAAGHGIVSKNDLVITGGNYEITAKDHGITGKDSIRIAGGTLVICAGKDGLHADNNEEEEKGFVYVADGNFNIDAGGDGLDASSSLTITGGKFTITSGGGKEGAAPHQNDDFRGGGFFWGGNFQGEEGNSSNSSDQNTDSVSTKGIKGSSKITITDGTFTINSADDALHSNADLCIAGGSFLLTTGDDGIHADNALVILDGNISVTESYEGIEGKTIEICGGDLFVRADDDGLNAAGGNDASGFGRGMDSFSSQEGVYIQISGGNIKIDADGDGIDSNGDLTVDGGTIYVAGPSNGANGALDKNGTAVISGGTLIALGAAGMSETFDSSSTQGCILVNTDSVHLAGTVVELLDESENVLFHYTSSKSFQSIVLSDPSILVGKTYRLKIGSEEREIVMETISYGTSSGMGGFGRPEKAPGGKFDRERPGGGKAVPEDSDKEKPEEGGMPSPDDFHRTDGMEV